MKTQRITGDQATLERLLEEFLMSGYRAEIDGDALVVYYGQAPKKSKKKKGNQQQTEKWSKRERNFGYTRG